METVQQNGRFTLFSSKFPSIYSILYAYGPEHLFIEKNFLQIISFSFNQFSYVLMLNNEFNSPIAKTHVKSYLITLYN